MSHSVVLTVNPHDVDGGRLAALEIVGRSGSLLRGADDVLLPAIHATWPALAARLGDANAAVQLVAMRVVAGLAEVSGTFMKLRVATDAIPALCKLLRSENSKAAAADAAAARSSRFTRSYNAAAARSSRFTRSYKLELGALNALERLSAALQIGGDGSEGLGATVGAAVGVYLHAEQPRELQQRAAELLVSLAADDPDAV